MTEITRICKTVSQLDGYGFAQLEETMKEGGGWKFVSSEKLPCADKSELVWLTFERPSNGRIYENDKTICWIDVETTGLDQKTEQLLEVALVVTDEKLVELGAISVVIDFQRPVRIDDLHPKVVEMHTKNGLFDEIASGNATPLRYAQDVLVARVKDLSERLGFKLSSTPLGGSTVGFDRKWIEEHMPNLAALFHYRSIDVSTVTELASRFNPDLYARRPKGDIAHRALADVRSSIDYLRFYLDEGFIFSQEPDLNESSAGGDHVPL